MQLYLKDSAITKGKVGTNKFANKCYLNFMIHE